MDQLKWFDPVTQAPEAIAQVELDPALLGLRVVEC